MWHHSCKTHSTKKIPLDSNICLDTFKKQVFKRIFLFVPKWDASVFVYRIVLPEKQKKQTLFIVAASSLRHVRQKQLTLKRVAAGGKKLCGKRQRQEAHRRVAPRTAAGFSWQRRRPDGYVSASGVSAKPNARASSGVKPFLRVRLTARREVGCSQHRHIRRTDNDGSAFISGLFMCGVKL